MAKKLARRSTSKKSAVKKSPGPGSRKHVYFFGNGKADGDRTMKDLLGGKGSGLAEMTNAGLPVPAGFTISTAACMLYYKEGRKTPAAVDKEMLDNLAKLEKAAGAKLGDVKNPLLVSVRSGAKFSMPGMMDTILNLGLNDKTVEGLKARTKNGRFAYDSYRRFIQMYGNVVLEIPKDAFEKTFEDIKHARGAHTDTDLDEAGLQEVVRRYKEVVKAKSRRDFPQDPLEQLRGARDAVFRSWNNARAIEYRRIYEIPDSIGTAVNVQMMVFGNMGDRSATGVGFTTRRGKTSSRGSARRSRSASCRTSCRRHTRSCGRSPRGSRNTTRTSRTSSSRFRTTGCTCCRRATASARATPPS
jgi:pyruvate, orthophosphate dikinase